MLSRLRLIAISAALAFGRCAPEPLALVLATQAGGARAFANAASSRYTVFVAATTAAGFSSPDDRGGQPPPGGVFASVVPLHVPMGGPGRGSLRARRFFCPGLLTSPCARPPRLAAGSGVKVRRQRRHSHAPVFIRPFRANRIAQAPRHLPAPARIPTEGARCITTRATTSPPNVRAAIPS